MSGRKLRKQTIQAWIEEDGYGTGLPSGESWAADNAIPIINPQFRLIRDTLDREILRPYLGASDQLLASRAAELSFEVELAPSGTAGTAPAWGQLLRACGMAETVGAGTKVTYNPIDDDVESLVLRYYRDGAVYRMHGCRGNFRLMLDAYAIPKLAFTFMGFDTLASETTLTVDLAAWKVPEVVNSANSADIKLGCTLAAGGGLTSGTSYKHRGLNIDFGNRLEHMKIVNDERIEIVERSVSGQTTLQLSAADEVTFRTAVTSLTTTGFGFVHGSATGKKVTAFAPKMQRVDPQVADYNGEHLTQFELRCLPSSGDDDLSIVCW